MKHPYDRLSDTAENAAGMAPPDSGCSPLAENYSRNAENLSRTSGSGSSPRQLAYLEAERRHRVQVRIVRAMILILFLALWELLAELDMIDSFIFSSPGRILACFLRMAADGSIFLHTGITLLETLISFLLTVVIAVAAAVLLWASRSLSEILEP